MSWSVCALAMTLTQVGISAFMPVPPLVPTHHRAQPLYVSWWDRDDESRRAAEQNNIMRTDVRNFLTQRSLQSFIQLCMECRDPHTVKWLEDFGGWENLENFHGTGGLNTTIFPTWSSVLTGLTDQPEDVVVVSVSKNTGSGGIPGTATGKRKKNPYLEERVVEINIDIDPTSLANRILSVREQIATEWISDLETLKMSNDMLLKSYNERIEKERGSESEDAEDKDGDEKGEVDNHPQIAFDRDAITLFRGSVAFADRESSPMRHGNFDLLALLLTQESIHRVLRDYLDAGSEREVSFRWFRDYYTKRASAYFDGDQEIGRADDFMEELLQTPPAIKNDDGVMSLVDPLRVAEDIIAVRSEVAMEWKSMMELVKEDHIDVRRIILSKQMIKWGHKPAKADDSTEVQKDEKPATTTAKENKVPSKESVHSEDKITSKDEVMGEFQ